VKWIRFLRQPRQPNGRKAHFTAAIAGPWQEPHLRLALFRPRAPTRKHEALGASQSPLQLRYNHNLTCREGSLSVRSATAHVVLKTVCVVVISTAFTACRASGDEGRMPAPGKIAPILLFKGTGTSPGDVAALEKILSSERLNYSTVNSPQQVRSVSVGLVLWSLGRMALGSLHCQTRNCNCLAPQRIPIVLDLEGPPRSPRPPAVVEGNP
jgi:hypothetical protein